MNVFDDDFEPNALHTFIDDVAYSDEFLKRLAERFRFDLSDPLRKHAIRRIALVYVLETREEREKIEHRPIERETYREFQREIAALIARFDSIDTGDLDMFMQVGSRWGRKEPSPQTKFPELKQWEYRGGMPYVLELKRLLKTLQSGIDTTHGDMSAPRGRRRQYGLETLARHASRFWEEDLGRRLTVDYHDGADETEAYAFVRALSEPFGDVHKTNLVTVMRRVISERPKQQRGRRRKQADIDADE